MPQYVRFAHLQSFELMRLVQALLDNVPVSRLPCPTCRWSPTAHRSSRASFLELTGTRPCRSVLTVSWWLSGRHLSFLARVCHADTNCRSASKHTVLLQHAGSPQILFLHMVPHHHNKHKTCAAAACCHWLTVSCPCRWVPHHLPAQPWRLTSRALTTQHA